MLQPDIKNRIERAFNIVSNDGSRFTLEEWRFIRSVFNDSRRVDFRSLTARQLAWFETIEKRTLRTRNTPAEERRLEAYKERFVSSLQIAISGR